MLDEHGLSEICNGFDDEGDLDEIMADKSSSRNH
jgi:hypothetical protein